MTDTTTDVSGSADDVELTDSPFSDFLGFELLSIPLYVLCATEMRRASSLESGLKYLVLGSVGSATPRTGGSRLSRPSSRRRASGGSASWACSARRPRSSTSSSGTRSTGSTRRGRSAVRENRCAVSSSGP